MKAARAPRLLPPLDSAVAAARADTWLKNRHNPRPDLAQFARLVRRGGAQSSFVLEQCMPGAFCLGF